MAGMWTRAEEAARLKERFKTVQNQAKFAREHSVPGGASMLSQHMSGNRPISMEAAVAYARAFKVPLAEISPRLAKEAAAIANSITGAGAVPSQGAVGRPAVAGPPPAPDSKFSDRHDVNDSDWALLQAVKIVVPDVEKERILAEAERIRREAAAQLAALGGGKP